MVDLPPDAEGARRRFSGYLLSSLALVWVLLAVALVTIVGLEALAMEDTCPVPGPIEAEGEVHWQWWPPGEVCTFGDATLEEPRAVRAWAVVAVVVLGVVLLVAGRRAARAPDPDWAA